MSDNERRRDYQQMEAEKNAYPYENRVPNLPLTTKKTLKL